MKGHKNFVGLIEHLFGITKIEFWYVYISTWSYENRVSKHFVISRNFACVIACLLSCLLMPFFLLFVLWLGLGVDAAIDRISRISICSPPPPTPSVFSFFPSYPQFSLENK